MNTKPDIQPNEIISRLYKIRNIAHLVSLCQEEKTDAYVLISVGEQIAGMIKDLIEDLDK